MLKQAQELQKQMQKMQEELESSTFEATVGGGMVKAVVSGKQRVESLEINPDAVDPDDVDMLQDLVLAAINDALDKSQESAASRLSGLTGGLNIPGLT